MYKEDKYLLRHATSCTEIFALHFPVSNALSPDTLPSNMSVTVTSGRLSLTLCKIANSSASSPLSLALLGREVYLPKGQSPPGQLRQMVL